MKLMAALVSTLVSLLVATPSFASSPGVAWFDLMVKDLPSTEKFYGSVFGWTTKPEGKGYYLVESGGSPIGGFKVTPVTVSGDGITIYFEVENTKVKLEQAKNEGATTLLEPRNLPSGKGSFALFRDLEGNPIGLISKNPI